MPDNLNVKKGPHIFIEVIKEFKATDLEDLCDATEGILEDNSLSFNIGIKKLKNTDREFIKSYWKGLLLVPDREIIVGRIDGVIAASIQLVKPNKNNDSSSFRGKLEYHFVAPWARGYGLAKELIFEAENIALQKQVTFLTLKVRENLIAAKKLYESLGYIKWGCLEKYEMIDNHIYAGHFYCKDLQPKQNKNI